MSRVQTPSHSGRKLLGVLLLLVLGAGGGLFYLAKTLTPQLYRQSRAGAPPRTLRIAVADIDWDPGLLARARVFLGKANPDFILLQRVTRTDAAALANELQMKADGKTQFFYATLASTDRTSGGCAILARHRLYRFREVPHGAPEIFAVTAECVIDGRRFQLASAAIGGETVVEQSAELRREMGLLGLEPSICGGLLAGRPPDGTRTLASVERLSLAATPDWKMDAKHDDGAFLWLDLAPAGK